jgi:hypothetical protein
MLAGMPRRRDVKTRPMIAVDPQVWDAAPLNAVLVQATGRGRRHVEVRGNLPGGEWQSDSARHIPTQVNTLANYSAAMVAGAPHPQAARAWLDFIGSDGAFRILERYGFRRFVVNPQ